MVLSIVGDGDADLFRAYPLDSVMPFWLMQETLFNAIDWLYNCVEPEANADNAFTVCGNLFDGGAGAFQARLRIDRIETWTAGGPAATTAVLMMVESARSTHQSTPVCCGEPHTAGRSNLVHFFTGKAFNGSAGNAAVGGLNVYGDSCLQPADGGFCCHHGVSQVVPGRGTPGTLFQLQLLVAHEIGHNTGGEEDRFGLAQDWLFGEKSGPTLMHSGFDGFPSEEIFVYEQAVAENKIAPLLEQRLGAAPVTGPCSGSPVM
ncbi:MAG: zinc-dependent metalloprotease family protein [Phycisphaerales bacterium]